MPPLSNLLPQALQNSGHTSPLLALPQPLLFHITGQCAAAELGTLSLTCKAMRRTLYKEKRRQAGTLDMLLSACRKLLMVPELPAAVEAAAEAGPDEANLAVPALQGTLPLVLTAKYTTDSASVVLEEVADDTAQQQVVEQQLERLLMSLSWWDLIASLIGERKVGLTAMITANNRQAAADVEAKMLSAGFKQFVEWSLPVDSSLQLTLHYTPDQQDWKRVDRCSMLLYGRS